MSSRKGLLVGCVFVGCVVAIGANAAQDQDRSDVAVLEARRGFLEWTPLIDAAGSTLALSGPDGEVRTLRFDAGIAPTWPLIDAEGAPLAEGAYTWEIRLQPSGSGHLQRAMEEARRAGDDRRLAGLQRLAAPFVQSGHFTIRDGSVVEGGESETDRGAVVAPDQTVSDDLVVDGKGCIGLGCNNNEAFLSEALRLKQSMVRLRFEDTSGGGFAGTDWQLSANEPGAGGLNKFWLHDLTANSTPMTVMGGAPNNSVFVDATGRLGLGTATPAQNLHVTGASAATLRLEKTAVPSRAWEIGGSNLAFTVRDVTGGSTEPLRIAAGAASDALVLGANGKVGIGGDPAAMAPLPPFALSIRGSVGSDAVIHVQNLHPNGFGGLSFYDSDGVIGFFFGIDNAANATRLNSVSNFPFLFLTQSVERMRIQPSGNVGVGTMAPSSRFHVNGGDIRVSGGSFIDDGTTLNAPDYVFESDYSLMPLDELRDFVAREKHLPNVPAAREIEAQGLNLSQFQMRLLEKIEELTLYALQQDEALALLRMENQQLLNQQVGIRQLAERLTRLEQEREGGGASGARP